MKRVIVSGASGFVGSHLALGLSKRGYQVMALGGSREVPGAVAAECSQSWQLELSDIVSLSSLFEEFSPEIVLHVAALANASECERHPEKAMQSNVLSTQALAQVCERHSAIVPLLYISTDLVFDGGEAPAGGFSETDAPCPRSIYGKTKLEGEQVALSAAVPAVVLRTSLVYGKEIEGRSGFLGWIRAGLSEGKPVSLFVDEWRTPVFVDDVLEACDRSMQALLRAGPRELSDTIHLAGSERLSRYEFGLKLAECFAYDVSLLQALEQSQAKGFRPRDVSLSVKRLVEELGFKPRSVIDGLHSLREQEGGLS